MAEPSIIRLYISGMTCASCAREIEKKLKNRGISASVDFATGSALLTAPRGFNLQKAIDVVRGAGYTATPRRVYSQAVRLRNLLASIALAVPVIVISMPMSTFVLLSIFPSILFWRFLVFVLATPVVIFSAWPFYRSCLRRLSRFGVTMDTLISLGVCVTYVWSVWVLFSSIGHPNDYDEQGLYFEASVSIVVFASVGRYLEAKVKAKQGLALESLVKLAPKTATLAGTLEKVLTENLRAGDRVVIYPGERVPADARIVEGGSDVDLSFLTGCSIPSRVSIGDTLASGAMNLTGNLTAEVVRVGSDTELSRLISLVQRAQKPKLVRVADRVSGVFVPVVLILSLVTLFAHWVVTDSLAGSLSAAVAVLVIACPCALGLATPMAILSGMLRGLQLGILIRSTSALESRLSVVVLDKTGTLTENRVSLSKLIPAPGQDVNDLLRLSASLEAGSEHPLARAVVMAAKDKGLVLESFSDFENHPGFGVTGKVAGRDILVGRLGWAGKTPNKMPDWMSGRDISHGTVIVWGGKVRGVFVFDSPLRATSPRGVALLSGMGLKVILATGDGGFAATNAAESCGIKTVVAGAKPADKLELVRSLQARKDRVAMVGDGINDAAALAAADVGIAMASGTDLAFDRSDIAVMSSDLIGVVDGIRLSRKTRRVVKQNLFWAFAYNTAGIPVASVGLLSPMIASLAMALSSLFVVGNSLRIRKFQPTTPL